MTLANSFKQGKSNKNLCSERSNFLRLYSRGLTFLIDGIITKYLLPEAFTALKEKVIITFTKRQELFPYFFSVRGLRICPVLGSRLEPDPFFASPFPFICRSLSKFRCCGCKMGKSQGFVLFQFWFRLHVSGNQIVLWLWIEAPVLGIFSKKWIVLGIQKRKTYFTNRLLITFY